MARGSSSKENLKRKLLEIFPNSFLYNSDKEIRVPMVEDGSPIEIKITLTAAKDIVGGGAPVNEVFAPVEISAPVSAEPTDEEKENVATLLRNMGF